MCSPSHSYFSDGRIEPSKTPHGVSKRWQGYAQASTSFMTGKRENGCPLSQGRNDELCFRRRDSGKPFTAQSNVRFRARFASVHVMESFPPYGCRRRGIRRGNLEKAPRRELPPCATDLLPQSKSGFRLFLS